MKHKGLLGVSILESIGGDQRTINLSQISLPNSKEDEDEDEAQQFHQEILTKA